MAVPTPLGWAASRWELGPRALRWSTLAALVVAILVVLGGGIVRVTGSGLGCPTWPTCDGTNLAPIPELGIHGVIEFGNRLVTVLLILAVGWAIIAARLQRPRDRALTRLAWSQFWLVVANAVAGGVTVLAQLNPWVVALHFVLAMGLLATATLTFVRVRRPGTAAAAPSTRLRALAWATVGVTAVLVVVGTIVSGAGPHAGDSADIPRMAVDWSLVVVIHGVLAAVVIVLTVAVVVVTRGPARRTAIAFLVVLLAQGLIGLVQSLTGLPELVVALHLLGAALVWVGVLRVLLDVDPTLFRTRAAEPATRDASLPSIPASL